MMLRRLSLSWLWTLLTVGGAGVAAATDLDVDGTFLQLQGSPVRDAGLPGDDWNTVLFGGSSTVHAKTGVIADPAPGSIFTGGGSKDGNDISQWRFKDGSVPDKDNITNAYAAAYIEDGQLLIYFGADRFDNSGDAQLGFWFTQERISLANGRFVGQHVVGDILALVNFEGGGTVPTVEVLKWVGTGGNEGGGSLQVLVSGIAAKCDGGGHEVCAITNVGPVAAPWAYTPKSGPSGVFPPATFFEGGINLTRILGTTEQPCFASFIAETRSSSSVTATLKDFAVGAFPVCSMEIAKTCDSININADETKFSYGYSINVKNTGLGRLYDVNINDQGQLINLGSLTAGETKTHTGSFESTVNGATNTAFAFAATQSGGAVSLTTESVVAQCPTMLKAPAIDVTKSCETQLVVENGRTIVKVNFAGEVCNPEAAAIGLTGVKLVDNSGTSDVADDLVVTIGDLPAGTCKPYSGSYYPNAVNSAVPGHASFQDTVVATGTAHLGFGNASASRNATCDLCPNLAALSISTPEPLHTGEDASGTSSFSTRSAVIGGAVGVGAVGVVALMVLTAKHLRLKRLPLQSSLTTVGSTVALEVVAKAYENE